MTNDELKIISSFYKDNKDKYMSLTYSINGCEFSGNCLIDNVRIMSIDMSSGQWEKKENSIENFFYGTPRGTCIIRIENKCKNNMTFIPLSNIVSITLNG